MNLGFVIGHSAVAVIDSGYGGTMADSMIAQIETITDTPIGYLINTNSQPHRVMGNSVLREHGVEIIAGAGAVGRIVDQSPAFASTVESVLDLETGSVKRSSGCTGGTDG